jgi:hypothetical protein
VSRLLLVVFLDLFKYISRKLDDFVELSKNFCHERTRVSGPRLVNPLVPVNWIVKREAPPRLPITSFNQAHFKNVVLQTVRVQDITCLPPERPALSSLTILIAWTCCCRKFK